MAPTGLKELEQPATAEDFVNDFSTNRPAAALKVARLRSGKVPRVLDLFAGCGGFSLGFQRAGGEIIGGVELDKHAVHSHAINFHGQLRTEQPSLFEAHCRPRDIVREATRLRSFPDGFRFSGSMNPGFRQVGKAAPPLFAPQKPRPAMRRCQSAMP